MPGNTDYNTLFSTTLKNYRKTLADNIFKHNFVFNYMFEKGRTDMQNGGYSIIQPIMYGESTAKGWYSGYDSLDTTPQEGITAAEYKWKQAFATITISGEEERKNNGEQALINLLKAKIQQAEKSLESQFAKALFAEGSGDEMNGLKHFMQDDPTGSEEIGGINQSTNTWWRNYTYQCTRSSADYDTIVADMMKLYNRTRDGSDHIDLIVTDITTFEEFEKALTTTVRFHPGMTDTKLAEVGFDNYKVKGATLSWDEECEAEKAYGINTDYLNFVVHPDANFTNTPFVTPENQDARTAKILWMGNLTCSNRKRQGKLYRTSGS